MVRIGDVLRQDAPSIYRMLAGGVTTINVLHGSANTIGGQNAVVKLRWGLPVDSMLFAGAPAGTYRYFCTPHIPFGMHATLTVQ